MRDAVAVPEAGGFEVAAAAGRRRVVHRHADERAWVVIRHFQTLDVDRERLAPLADAPGGLAHPLGQDGANVLLAGDLPDQRQHGVGVPEAQLDPAGVRRADQAALEGFHGERDHPGGRDGVQPVAIAQRVRQRHRLEAADPARAAEAGQRLVLHALAARGRVRRVFDLDLLAAADGAGVAVRVLDQVFRVEGLAGQVHRLGPVAQGPVADGQVAELLGAHDAARGAQVAHGLRVFLDELVLRLDLVAEPLGVGVFRPRHPAHRDRLEVLAAQQRAHAPARGRAHVVRTART